MEKSDILSKESGKESDSINWPSMITAWLSSGLTRKKFCEQQHLNYHQFLYQRVKWGQKSKMPLPHWLKVHGNEKASAPAPTMGATLSPGFLLKSPSHQLSIPLNADAFTLKILLNFMKESLC